MVVLLAALAWRRQIGAFVGSILSLAVRPFASGVVRRRRRRLGEWRATLKAGDRCWVIGPRGDPIRSTIRRREEETVDLLTSVDKADGERCWMGVSLQRVFPDEPAAWEIEAFEMAERERLLR